VHQVGHLPRVIPGCTVSKTLKKHTKIHHQPDKKPKEKLPCVHIAIYIKAFLWCFISLMTAILNELRHVALKPLNTLKEFCCD
jgi:hypothetical protein